MKQVIITTLPFRVGTYLCVEEGTLCTPVARFISEDRLQVFREWIIETDGMEYRDERADA